MRKLIDLDQVTLRKLKLIAALENTNVKNLIEEKIVGGFLKSNARLKKMTEEEKEDLGLYLAMKETEEKEAKFIDREKIIRILEKE